MIGHLHKLYKELQGEGVLFCFSGPTTQGVLESIGDALRRRMGCENADTNTTQRVFAIFVEQVQNIIHYSADCGPCAEDLRCGVVVVGNADGKFFVICGNKIERGHQQHMETRLKQVQGMDKAQLKALYKELRRQDPEEGSMGAGLGLVDMARRASEPLEYHMLPLSEHHAFFSIKAVG